MPNRDLLHRVFHRVLLLFSAPNPLSLEPMGGKEEKRARDAEFDILKHLLGIFLRFLPNHLK